MNSPSAQFFSSRGMGIYEPIHQIGMWGENFKSNNVNPTVPTSMIVAADMKQDSQSEDTSHGTLGPPNQYDQKANKPSDRSQRRLAQNRLAARKCRLRKKAYVQQLESSRQKLVQLEQELDRARQQGLYLGSRVDTGHPWNSGTVNAGIAAFEMKYEHWLEEQSKQICELRNALTAHISEVEIQFLVENAMSHYFELFRTKDTAAKADVFYVMSGMWMTSAERFFLWIGGFRPSELLKVLKPHLDPLTEQQTVGVCILTQSCQQAEDALSQGLEKLQQTLAHTIATIPLPEETYMPQMASAVKKFDALVRFVQQADYIRRETLLQMSQILTTRQAAWGLLALEDYFKRLRALSSLWATRHHEAAQSFNGK